MSDVDRERKKDYYKRKLFLNHLVNCVEKFD